MVAVSITTVAAGIPIGGSLSAYTDWPSIYSVANIYQVAITLSADEMPPILRGPIPTDKWVYPIEFLPQPKAITRTQLSDSLIREQARTGAPGKALKVASLNAGVYTPSNGNEATVVENISASGSIYQMVAPSCITGVDTGFFLGDYSIATGITAGTFDGATGACPSCDIYLFYLNIDSDAFTRTTPSTFGINNATLNALFGPNCIGIQLSFEYYSYNNAHIKPVYKANGMLAVNANQRPSFARPNTFSARNAFQRDWTALNLSSGTIPSQTFYAPPGYCLWKLVDQDPNVSAQKWTYCNGGTSENLMVILGPSTPTASLTLRIFYINILGKALNPTGTVLSIGKVDAQTPPGIPSFAYGTVAHPAGAVAYYLTLEDLVINPGVQTSILWDQYSHNTPRPAAYASDYADWVPGNCLKAAIAEADML